MLQYDVLIVGGGPAGCSAAIAAAKAGVSVLVVEKKKHIGEPVQCAELIPKLLLSITKCNHESIVHEIKGMNVYLPNNEFYQSNTPSYMINRALFDKELANQAEEHGAMLRTHTSCVSINKDAVVIKEKEKLQNSKAQVIIGADGPKSIVGEKMGSINYDFVCGHQYTVPLTEHSQRTEIYFDNAFFGGYAWLFPKKTTANVGVGIRWNHPLSSLQSITRLQKNFVQKLASENKIKNTVLSKTGGLIPVGGPLPTVKKNMLLVGDAAGHTHPITGGGIPQAVMCGRIAGDIAAQAVQENDIEILQSYEEEWKKIFGSELERAMQKRRLLESQWDTLDTIIKQCWVTCREYYE